MQVSRCIPLFAGAVALVITTTAHASSTTAPAKSATHASASAPAKSTAPAKSSTASHHAATAPADEHLAAIRQNLEQSRHNLRGYHWKENIVVSMKGEEKSTMMNSCVQDASGKVVRTPEPVPATTHATGMHSATPAAEKAELQSYEHSAVALMRSYVPPDPAKLQKLQQSGKMTTNVVEEGHRVKLSFKDYQKPGDEMTIEVNPQSNQILSLAVNSFLASAKKDAVTMNVDMASLPDGTTYPSKVRLDTPAKQMGVTVTNSDYQKKTS